MARQKNKAESVYRVTELVGTSKKSWEGAAKNSENRGSHEAGHEN